MLMGKSLRWVAPPLVDTPAPLSPFIAGVIAVAAVVLGLAIWIFGRGDKRFQKQYRSRLQQPDVDELRNLADLSASPHKPEDPA